MKHLKGSFETAKEMYFNCLKIDSKHVKSNYYLATLLLEKPQSINDFENIFNCLRVASNKIYADNDKNVQAKLKARKKFLEYLPIRTDILISTASNDIIFSELSKLYDDLYVELSDYPLYLFFYAHFFSTVVPIFDQAKVLSYYKAAADYFLKSLQISCETDYPILRNKSPFFSERKRKNECTIDFTYMFNYIELLLKLNNFNEAFEYLYQFEIVSNNSRLAYVGFAKVHMHLQEFAAAEIYLLKSFSDVSFSFLASYLPKDFKYPAATLNETAVLSKEFIQWTETDFKIDFNANRHNIIVAVETLINYFRQRGIEYYEILFKAICTELYKSVCRNHTPCIHIKYNMFCYCSICKRVEMNKLYNLKNVNSRIEADVLFYVDESAPLKIKNNSRVSKQSYSKPKVTPPKVAHFPELERNSSEETELELDKLLISQEVDFDLDNLL